jgi:hypothetical protein
LPSLPHKNFEDGLLSAGRLSDVWLLDIDGSTTLRQGAGFTGYPDTPGQQSRSLVTGRRQTPSKERRDRTLGMIAGAFVL